MCLLNMCITIFPKQMELIYVDLVLLRNHLVLNKYQQVSKKRDQFIVWLLVMCVTCASN